MLHTALLCVPESRSVPYGTVILHAAAILLPAFFSPTAGAQVSDEVIERWGKRMAASQQAIDDEYASVTLEMKWTTEITKVGEEEVQLTVKEARFWQSGTEYFRYDEKIVDSSNAELINQENRIYVTPGLAIALLKKPDKSDFLVTSVMDVEQGQATVKSKPFYKQQQVLFQTPRPWPHFLPVEERRPEFTFEMQSITEDANQRTMSFACREMSAQYNLEAMVEGKLDTQNSFALLEAKQEISERDFEGIFTVSLEYDKKSFGSIPRKARHEGRPKEGVPGQKVADTIETLSVNHDSIPMEVFDPPVSISKPLPFTWGRRLALLVVALLAGALFLVMRKRRAA